MIILKASTKAGQRILKRADQHIGITLRDVYNSWSRDKEDNYNDCYEKYCATPEHANFGICAKNTYMFTVSWFGLYNDEEAVFYETKTNSFVVLLNK